MADPKDTETTDTAYEATVNVEETVRQPAEKEPTTTTETTEQSTETTETTEPTEGE